MRYDSPEEVLRTCIEHMGGFKSVGVWLRPELEERPETAGRWLADCLNDEKREKLSLQQVTFILRRARDAGFHEGMHAWNRLCGYSPCRPLNDSDELVMLQRQAMEAAMKAQEASRELFARMTAAGLKVGEL